MLPISQITDEKVALEIGLPDELLEFARMVNSGELSGRADVKVRLTADIDLTGHQWTPIGLGKAQFGGRFDGCGHTISAVTIQKKWPGNYGLFGYVTGAIQNVTVTGSITCVAADVHSAVGGIAGLVVGGHISNCTADLTIDSNRLSLGMYAGGVVGQITEGTIRGCRSSTRFENVLGNFLYHIDGDGVILESVNRGSVSGGCRAAGGIAGWISMDYNGKTPLTAVDCCLNLGDVIQSPNSPGGSCGGIVGEIYNKPLDASILVRNCVSLGNLILRDSAGRALPNTAHADGAVFEHNYFDQRLSVQGEGVPQEQVAQGCTARPVEKLLAELPELDSRYTIGPDGALTIRNLEIGGGI